jgi:hypothetical protein
MRVLVDEQGAGAQEVVPVQVLPLVGHGPVEKALRGQRMGGRAEPEHVQQQRLAVAFPAVVQKAALGLPAVHQRRAVALRPAPIDPAVQRIGERAQLGSSAVSALK